MSIKKFVNAVQEDNKNRAEAMRYHQDKQNRKAKAKIRQESEDGRYEGPGLGKAKARELARRVAEDDIKDKQKYGGMDMLTKEQAEKKAYGGKVKKMADGKMVTKKKKTTKVARRRGDGCAVKGKTRGRMV